MKNDWLDKKNETPGPTPTQEFTIFIGDLETIEITNDILSIDDLTISEMLVKQFFDTRNQLEALAADAALGMTLLAALDKSYPEGSSNPK